MLAKCVVICFLFRKRCAFLTEVHVLVLHVREVRLHSAEVVLVAVRAGFEARLVPVDPVPRPPQIQVGGASVYRPVVLETATKTTTKTIRIHAE